MAVIEKIKDWLGILDDVGDFVDRAKATRAHVERLIKGLEDEGEQLSRVVRAAKNSDDYKLVVSFIKGAFGTGRSVKTLLGKDLAGVDRLIEKAKTKGFNDVVPALRSLKKTITTTVLKHRSLINGMDKVLRAYSRVKREENIRLAARVLVGALGSFLATTLALRAADALTTPKIAAVADRRAQLVESVKE